MKYTESQLRKIASPISQTEEEKCKNAIRMVRDALKKLNYTDDDKEIRSFDDESYSFMLDLRKINSNEIVTILVQGSYANKTNIPSESDVDVAVILESVFYTKYRSGVGSDAYGFSEGKISAQDFKDEVENALNKHFGYIGVERHDKCIKVIGNSYRVDADVVAAFRHRDYSNDYSIDEENYVKGIEIRPDSGGRIINYPEQHIKNGISKNKRTNSNYKKCVRIIKNMREDMENSGYNIPSKITSFGLESLLWNVEDSVYTEYSFNLRFIFGSVIRFLKYDSDSFKHYKEVNGIKKLFNDSESTDAYKSFVSKLYDYYDYDIDERWYKMEDRIIRLIKKGVVVALLLLIVRYFACKIESAYSLFSAISEVVFVTVIIIELYNSFLWRFDFLEKTPRILGTYKGILLYDYGSKSKKELTIIIKQTFLSVKVIIKTNEITSYTISSNLEKENDEYVLYYTYITNPKSEFSKDNPIQRGTCRLVMVDSDRLNGTYWTSRQTIGDIEMTKIKSTN